MRQRPNAPKEYRTMPEEKTVIPFSIAIPKEAQLALDVLSQNGFTAYIVGGAVRDALMGRAPHDFDVASPSTPNQTMRCFPGYCIERSGLKHGTVRVIIHKYPIEITTFRTEADYQDFRHPNLVDFITSPYIDSKRRDFTVDAFYYRNGEVTDFHHGLEDLKSKTIRAIGNPVTRFQEDALRILRGLRFATEFGFAIEPQTKAAMAQCANELFQISEERIEGETLRMAGYPNFLNVIRENLAVFDVIFPGVKAIDPTRLSLKATASPFVNLAILFKLLGLNQSKAEALLRSLKFSSSNLEAILSLLAIDPEFTVSKLASSSDKPLRLFLLMTAPLNPETALDYVRLRDMAEDKDVSGFHAVMAKYQTPKIHDIPVSKRELMVTGNDLKRLGYPAGPAFKVTLDELLLQVNQGNVGLDRKAQLAWLKKRLESH